MPYATCAGIEFSQISLRSEYITGISEIIPFCTLTLRKLDQELLLEAGMLLCGSLLEAMAVGWRFGSLKTGMDRKDEE